MAQGAIQVEGFQQLARDFRRMSKDLTTDLVWELQEAADPVRKVAEQLAVSEIRNMPPTPYFAGQKIGVVRGSFTVYMVPDWRRGSRSRPNLSALLLERAMEPALDREAPAVFEKVDNLLGRLGGEYDFY